MSAYDDLKKRFNDVIQSHRLAKSTYEQAAANALADIESLWEKLGCGGPALLTIEKSRSPNGVYHGTARLSVSTSQSVAVAFTIHGSETGGAVVRVEETECTDGGVEAAFIDAFTKAIDQLRYTPPRA